MKKKLPQEILYKKKHLSLSLTYTKMQEDSKPNIKWLLNKCTESNVK